VASVEIVADPIEACGRALAEALIAADKKRGHARLAIPGGSALAALGPARIAMGPEVWSRLDLTWGDERCVPFDSAESARGAAYRAGLLDSAFPVRFELPLYEGGEQPGDAVARVVKAFGESFEGAIDVALVGLGPDGHVASLFPGHAALVRSEPVLYISDSPKPPPERITMSLQIFLAAQVFGVARGSDKKTAVDDVARGAGLLHHLRLFTDGSTR